MRPETVRIGDVLFRLDEGLYEKTGLRPFRRLAESIFADRQSLPGRPGWQNVRTEDLRWVTESWRGAGQMVIDPASEDSFALFEWSSGIDAGSRPGQLLLSRDLIEETIAAGSSTVVEGSSFTEDVAPTTVVGSDVRLDAEGARVRYDAALAAGTWRFSFRAYREADPVIVGSSFIEEAPVTVINGSEIRLKTVDAIVRTENQTPGAWNVTVRYTVRQSGGKSASVKAIIWNQTNSVKVAERSTTLSGDGDVVTFSITYNALASKTYRYKLRLTDAVGSGFNYVALEQVEVATDEPQVMLWEVQQGTTTLDSGTVDLNGTMQSEDVAVTTQVLGAATYRLQVTRQSGSRRLFLDKLTYESLTIGDPRALEIGADGAIWLADANQNVAKRSGGTWSVVGTIAAGTPSCLAHTDDREFIGSSNGVVYRATAPSTVEQFTAAVSGSVVGLAVAGGRLMILAESSAGPHLYDVPLTGALPLAPTSRYDLSSQGWATGDDLPQPIAATRSGCVFLTRMGPDSWVHEWDGSAGAPLARLPSGFRAQAITHMTGTTWVGGVLAGRDGVERPAVLVLTPDGSVEQVPASLSEDGDGTPLVRWMGANGPTLWIATEAGQQARVWRLDLASGGSVCAYRKQIGGESYHVRGLATGSEFVMAVSGLSPYVLGDYPLTGTLRSSRYAFSLTEPKVLHLVELSAEIPDGSRVEVWAVPDGTTPTLVASMSDPGVVGAGNLPFRSLAYELRLVTTDPAVTPVVYALDLRARVARQDERIELVCACLDETSVWHLGGRQLRGQDGIDYLFGLASSGEAVDVDLSYGSLTGTMVVQRVDAFYVRPGEAYARVILAPVAL